VAAGGGGQNLSSLVTKEKEKEKEPEKELKASGERAGQLVKEIAEVQAKLKEHRRQVLEAEKEYKREEEEEEEEEEARKKRRKKRKEEQMKAYAKRVATVIDEMQAGTAKERVKDGDGTRMIVMVVVVTGTMVVMMTMAGTRAKGEGDARSV